MVGFPWHPEVFAARRNYLAGRNKIVSALRSFFKEKGFEEVETPSLQVSPGLEPNIGLFQTTLNEPLCLGARDLFLHTSPEYAMKKLLVAGVERPFQISRVFRNESRSSIHHPEFSMLEWYRARESVNAIVQDCEEIILTAVRTLPGHEEIIDWRNQKVPVAAPFDYLSVAEAFNDNAAISIMETLNDDGTADKGRLKKVANCAGFFVGDTDTWEDIFFRIFVEAIEPNLGFRRPLVLYDWPAPLASLASLDSVSPKIAKRFEIYVAGMELANGFEELTDPNEYLRRFNVDQSRRARLGVSVPPVDKDLLQALEFGMPPASGVAMGLDRLVMLATGAKNIDEVLWLPVVEPGSS